MNTILNRKRHILRSKIPLISSIIAGIIAGAILLGMIVPQTAKAETFLNKAQVDKFYLKVVKKIKMVVTAYSSTPEQTDSTPFITSSGKNVADGIVANNMLPFGSKIRIPDVYGDKIFIVEDRMHRRKGKYHLDIWFPEYSQAKKFGAKITYIEVLED
ncbi:MAG: hypothetical protein AAB529_02300 [Patescibacteria group bacterium]